MAFRSRIRYATVTASGSDWEEAEAKAVRYARRTSPTGSALVSVIAHRRRHVKIGLLGYRAWDFRLRIVEWVPDPGEPETL